MMESNEIGMLIEVVCSYTWGFSDEDFLSYLNSNLDSVRCGQIEWVSGRQVGQT